MTRRKRELPRIRRDCRFYLSYANRHFCKLPWTVTPGADPRDLSLGCVPNCPDHSRADWLRGPDLVVKDDDTYEEVS